MDAHQHRLGDAKQDFSSKRSTKSGSKYDYVKVRVWLTEEDVADDERIGLGSTKKHYYVLSRFLLARMLTASGVPKKKATQIMLELKKKLVDENRLDISQKQLEREIFSLLETKGFSEKYVESFGMITSFYHRKIPLIVLICGTACVGKSMIATHLAERLNLPNVLQTDLFAQIIRMSEGSPMHQKPLWERETVSLEEAPSPGPADGDGGASPASAPCAIPMGERSSPLLHEFRRECACVRRSLEGDLEKTLQDGKSIILEGTYLDPAMFTNLFPRPAMDDSGAATDAANRLGAVAIDTADADSDKDPPNEIAGAGAGAGAAAADGTAGHPKTFRPIVVPIVLAMEKEAHVETLEQWTKHTSAHEDDRARTRLYRTLSEIQSYYVKYAKNHEGTVKLCYVDPMEIQDTVDVLHSHLLEEILKLKEML